MSTQAANGGERGGNPRSAPNGISIMQMNFRGSETTWILCQQELLDRNVRPDIILVQDPPFSVCMGKNVSRGYKLIRPVSHGPCFVVVLVRDNVRVRSARPFGRRVVGVEIVGSDGPLVVMSAYLRHSTGEGLDDLDRTIRWAKGRSP